MRAIKLLNSDEFRNNFSDEQRELLRGMTDLNLGPKPLNLVE